MKPLFTAAELFEFSRSREIIPGHADTWDVLRDKCNEAHEKRCPYKARIDNDNGNEYTQVMAMKEEIVRLREALEGLRYYCGPADEQHKGCWCDVAIGDPRMSGHADSCDRARAVLEGK